MPLNFLPFEVKKLQKAVTGTTKSSYIDMAEQVDGTINVYCRMKKYQKK